MSRSLLVAGDERLLRELAHELLNSKPLLIAQGTSLDIEPAGSAGAQSRILPSSKVRKTPAFWPELSKGRSGLPVAEQAAWARLPSQNSTVSCV